MTKALSFLRCSRCTSQGECYAATHDSNMYGTFSSCETLANNASLSGKHSYAPRRTILHKLNPAHGKCLCPIPTGSPFGAKNLQIPRVACNLQRACEGHLVRGSRGRRILERSSSSWELSKSSSWGLAHPKVIRTNHRLPT